MTFTDALEAYFEARDALNRLNLMDGGYERAEYHQHRVEEFHEAADRLNAFFEKAPQ